jgi:2-hydroxychromene-2-carboxylate isomerase
MRDLRRAVHATRRRISGRPPTVHYFHQVDDPYSHLAAQLCAPLATRYRVDLVPWLVPSPEDEATPERARLRAYALRDAGRLARRFRLRYPQRPQFPTPELVAHGQAALTAAIRGGRFADLAPAIGSALWHGDDNNATNGAQPEARQAEVERALADGQALRRRLGHYFSAMFYFEGEWYWGVDRLHHLETRLAALGLDKVGTTAPQLAGYQKEQLAQSLATDRRLLIEFWFSFRSPYCYLAVPRVVELARHYGADLELRFIMPMIMRGLPVPSAKQMYIMRDTKREADMLDVPFGTMVDPRGEGIERANAVLYRAIAAGLGERFTELAFAGVFVKGSDLTTDAGLFALTRECGLRDDDVRAALADQAWRPVAEKNRIGLLDAGLWGAPTYRVDGMPAHWRRDRSGSRNDQLKIAWGETNIAKHGSGRDGCADGIGADSTTAGPFAAGQSPRNARRDADPPLGRSQQDLRSDLSPGPRRPFPHPVVEFRACQRSLRRSSV